MDNQIQDAFIKSKLGTNEEHYEAYQYILQVTEEQVDWAYEVWIN